MATIVIDPGHGGHDPGARGAGGEKESFIALDYALSLRDSMMRRGHRVLLTRGTDDFMTLGERARMANEADADLFVSVHANASGAPAASGPWTLHAKGSAGGEKAAIAVQKALSGVFGGRIDAHYPDASPQVGYTTSAATAIATGKKAGLSTAEALKRAGISQPYRTLAVLRQTRMPAILLELGFMTNTEDLRKMRDATTRKCAVEAVAAAIDGFFG